MSASQISICNIALSRVSARAITDINGSSQEAKKCKEQYDIMRDLALSDQDWGFAKRSKDLALRTETYSGYDYAYTYPTDCVKAREIFDDTGNLPSYYDADTYVSTGKIEFEVRTTDSKSEQVIVTDKEDAELIYTARSTNPAIYPISFVNAFAQRLGAELALGLKNDLKLYATLLSAYNVMIDEAKSKDANEGYKKPSNSSSFVNARS